MTMREKIANWISGGRIMELEDALREIASMETPSCAHIGKRMASKAREALRDDEV